MKYLLIITRVILMKVNACIIYTIVNGMYKIFAYISLIKFWSILE